MGDAARKIRTVQATETPGTDTAPRRYPERPTPRRVPEGHVRLRGVVPTRSGYVVRTYDVPVGLIDECLIHERVPDTLATASEHIAVDLYLEAQ